MKSWQVELTSGEENLGEVNIRQRIFQGDSLSPLLFVVSLLPLTHILLSDATPGYHFASNGQKVVYGCPKLIPNQFNTNQYLTNITDTLQN